jgi:hypothetical protein
MACCIMARRIFAEYLVSFADIKRLSNQLSCRAFNYITRQDLMQAK